ncbi:hypothetical protein D3C86_1993830 [compost metagenome]
MQFDDPGDGFIDTACGGLHQQLQFGVGGDLALPAVRRLCAVQAGDAGSQVLGDQRVRDALGTGPVRAGGQQQQDGIDGRHDRRV